MLQLLLFHLLVFLTSLGASLSLCGGGKKKKTLDGKSMKSATTPGGKDDTLKTAIDGGGSKEVGGSNENGGDMGMSGRISIHGPVHESKESAEQVEGESKPPSAETINMEKAAPGKVLVSKEKA